MAGDTTMGPEQVPDASAPHHFATEGTSSEQGMAVGFAGWLEALDQWCERLGDRLNPILVKETRQALKSRQFVTTFSVLLVAALGWTVVGSLSMMPQIYLKPSAPTMLIGYYVVLAIPMLLVVPLAAYRSLEGEIDDGTLELLSITVLSPRQIVLGKLASAMLQMLLYFVALFPCVAYAYTLRGVDLPTVALMISLLLVAGTLLTIFALFFAPLARTRTGRIGSLLLVMIALLGAEWGLANLVIEMILYGNPLRSEELFFVVLSTACLSFAIGDLLLAATTAQLTPESENRSTRIRLSLLLVTSVVIGLSAWSLGTLGDRGLAVAVSMILGLVVLWTAASGMLCAESPVVTPRVRRELPSSFLARVTLTWLTPGPATGLAFSTVMVVFTTAFVVVGCQWLLGQPGLVSSRTMLEAFSRVSITYSSYLICFLVVEYWLMLMIRRKNHPRVEVGIAALIAISLFSALLPYSIGLHFNDYREYSYSTTQITNWIWTIGVVGDFSGDRWMTPVWCVTLIAFVWFFVTIATQPKLVFPRRIALPKRVQQELDGTTT